MTATKGATEIKGLRDIRSMRSSGRCPILRLQSSAYLTLYMLRAEKERLDKEAAALKRRRQAIERRLEEIQAQMRRLERSVRAEGPKESSTRTGPERTWRTFSLRY